MLSRFYRFFIIQKLTNVFESVLKIDVLEFTFFRLFISTNNYPFKNAAYLPPRKRAYNQRNLLNNNLDLFSLHCIIFVMFNNFISISRKFSYSHSFSDRISMESITLENCSTYILCAVWTRTMNIKMSTILSF